MKPAPICRSNTFNPTLQAELSKCKETEKSGNYTFDDNQTRFPSKYVNRLLQKYKQPTKMDSREVPVINLKK